MYVRVAVNIPHNKLFSYSVPPSLRAKATVGRMALVPLGNRVVNGYVVECDIASDVDAIKEIADIVEDEPYFTEPELLFYQWISQYYLYPLGKALFDILPTPVSVKKERVVHLDPTWIAGENDYKNKVTGKNIVLKDQQKKMADLLLQGPVSSSQLKREFENASYLVRCLQKKGMIYLTEQEICRVAADLSVKGSEEHRISLNEDQKNAVRDILLRLTTQSFSPFLLHGVTGSGKTEVYLHVMEEVRALGGGVVSLVPEISLTPQLIERVRARFGHEEIAVIHSDISRSARYEQWRRIQRGEIKIVIGARSALFAPVRDLRLIIVDEEHDASYKQDERLRYNARDMAIVRAQLSNATVVLGSATPAVQTFYNARKNKYRYLALASRIENRPLPEVRIIDMRAARLENAEIPIFSQALQEGIARNLEKKQQTLLFLNRRGFDTLVLCTECGYIFKCLNCELTLTHHAARGVLQCHCCDFLIKADSRCPKCQSDRIRNYGLGTEKLEGEVIRLFPQARVGRMDSDTTARKGEGEKILRKLSRGELDILVGTQMITKGHDFPSITLVGVVAADLSLNVPDFRAGEKTFQLLTQVAGRGGRGTMPGLVIVQTFNPDQSAIRRAQHHDYNSFYEDEIILRKCFQYPPYTRMVNLHMSSAEKERGRKGVEKIGRLAVQLVNKGNAGKRLEILGPAEAPVAKKRGRYRWQMLLKGKDMKIQNFFIETIQAEALKSGLDVRIDVDPMNFL